MICAETPWTTRGIAPLLQSKDPSRSFKVVLRLAILTTHKSLKVIIIAILLLNHTTLLIVDKL